MNAVIHAPRRIPSLRGPVAVLKSGRIFFFCGGKREKKLSPTFLVP